jgi:F420H(2)-dependent quinone reductase
MTFSAEYAPSPIDWVRQQADTFEASGGTDGAQFGGIPIVLLTTVGAKSGKLRKSPLIRVEHGGQYAAIASNGGATTHPAWYGNLLKNPLVGLQDGAQSHQFHAREAHGDEYTLWWRRAVAVHDTFTGYVATAHRTIPIVVLSRADDTA